MKRIFSILLLVIMLFPTSSLASDDTGSLYGTDVNSFLAFCDKGVDYFKLPSEEAEWLSHDVFQYGPIRVLFDDQGLVTGLIVDLNAESGVKFSVIAIGALESPHDDVLSALAGTSEIMESLQPDPFSNKKPKHASTHYAYTFGFEDDGLQLVAMLN